MSDQEVIPGRSLTAVDVARARYELQKDQAEAFAVSALVPDHLRKQNGLANCYIALTMAEAMGELPIIVMQNIHIVNGKAGFSAQYMIARANSSGVFKGRIDWRIFREDKNNLAVEAFAKLADTEQEVSVRVDMAMAIAEGWTKNPKYKSMPEIMLRYRSAAFLVRFYAPDVMLGYQTSEEIEDVSIARGPDLTTTPLTSAMLVGQAAPREVEDAVTEEVDAETGEVTKQEEPEADFRGAVAPKAAKPGQSWFDTSDGRIRYAHDTNNGIKWYLKPPVADEPKASDGTLSDENPFAQEGPSDEQRGEEGTDEAAQETVEAIDGPLVQDEQPAWVAMVERAKENIAKAPDHATLKKLDTEFQKHMAVLPDEAVQDVDAAFAARRKDLNEAQEG